MGGSHSTNVSENLDRARGAMLKPSQRCTLEVALRKANHIVTFGPLVESWGGKELDSDTFSLRSSSRSVYPGDSLGRLGMEKDKPLLSLEVVDEMGTRTLLVKDPESQELRMMLCVDNKSKGLWTCGLIGRSRESREQEVAAAASLYSNDVKLGAVLGHCKGSTSQYSLELCRRGSEQKLLPVVADSNWGPFGSPGIVKYFRADGGKVGANETWVAEHTSPSRTPGLAKVSVLKMDPNCPMDPLTMIVMCWYTAIVVVDEALAGGKSFI